MRRLVKAVQAWRAGIGQYSPEQWAAIRVKGRGRFLLRQTFCYTVYGVALYDVVSEIYDYGHAFQFGFYIFQFAIGGFWFAYSVWGDHEAKYKKALNSSLPTPVQLH